jgi:hypothetical protein
LIDVQSNNFKQKFIACVKLEAFEIKLFNVVIYMQHDTKHSDTKHNPNQHNKNVTTLRINAMSKNDTENI